MKKEELVINGKKITIMEQPTSFILELERKHNDKDLVGYVQDILKYPADTNPKLEDILNLPNEIVFKDLKLSLMIEGKKDLHTAQELFVAFRENKLNPAYVGEKFLKKVGKNINNYKYKELIEIGEEVFKQVGEILYLIQIIETFRNM